MSIRSWFEGFLEEGPLASLVQWFNGALYINGVKITAFDEYSWTQFTGKNATDYVNSVVLITDRYSDLGSRAGVLVMGSTTGKWSMISEYMVTPWAGRPSDASYPGFRYLVTDFGLRPSRWTVSDDATPANNKCFADQSFIIGVGRDIALPAAFTSENVMKYLAIPSTGSAGGSAFKDGDVIRIVEAVEKTGGANTMILVTRAGVNHTTADTAILTISTGVSALSWGRKIEIERLSSTSLRIQAQPNNITAGSYSGSSTAAFITDATGLADIDTSGDTYYIDSGFHLNGTTDTSPSMKNWRAEFLPCGV